MTDSKEACTHRMRTYKSVVIGDYRKRYRVCIKCKAHDTLLVPMSFSYLKFDPDTKLGINAVEQTSESPTLDTERLCPKHACGDSTATN